MQSVISGNAFRASLCTLELSEILEDRLYGFTRMSKGLNLQQITASWYETELCLTFGKNKNTSASKPVQMENIARFTNCYEKFLSYL